MIESAWDIEAMHACWYQGRQEDMWCLELAVRIM